MSTRGVYVDTVLAAGSTTGTGNVVPVYGNGRYVTFFVIGSAGITAGQVTFEESLDGAYTGTWDPIGSVTPVASGIVAYHLPEGVYSAVRARITTNITGGTVTVAALVGN